MTANHTLSDFFIQQEQLELNDLFSPTVQLTRYDLDSYSDELYPYFQIHQPLQSKLWSNKRKAQYLAGRLAAREALHSIGSPKPDIPIPSGHHREPLWPQNTLGSISHAEGFSVATAMNDGNFISNGIGLDVQEIISDTDLDLLSPSVLTTTDRLIYEAHSTGLSRNQIFTLIFSAKESFFKAAYGSVREYFNFDAVSVCDIDVEYQQITIICEHDLSSDILFQNEYPIFVDILDIGSPVALTYSVV